MTTNKRKILRQSLSNRVVHWVTAISIFSLIISGLGQLPMYNRYNVTKLPNAAWLGEYSITLIMHYVGAIVLVFIVFYHLFVHLFQKQFDIMPKKGDVKESWHIIKAMVTKGEEPPSDKYLAEQRLAYLAIGVVILLLVFSGLVKVLKNTGFITFPDAVLTLATQIHNFGTIAIIFLIVAHLGAFAIKANRKLIPGMITGYVDEEYVKHRHPIWYAKLNNNEKAVQPRKVVVKKKKARNPAYSATPYYDRGRS